jgi:UDP-N-acetylmuramoyl-L-alanyl-D-glutamate--2,6-diaminopimelate ligase
MMAASSTMPGVPLSSLLEGMELDSSVPELAIRGLSADSREVRPGDLFLASRGIQVHALDFVERAIEQGAVAVLWEPVADARIERKAHALPVPAIAVAGLAQKAGLIADRFYASPSSEMFCIGVTGTDGKTSV